MADNVNDEGIMNIVDEEMEVDDIIEEMDSESSDEDYVLFAEWLYQRL